MCCATSSLPLFFRYVVTPVAQKVGLPVGVFDASVARAALNHPAGVLQHDRRVRRSSRPTCDVSISRLF
jgi:hypothetical protein